MLPHRHTSPRHKSIATSPRYLHLVRVFGALHDANTVFLPLFCESNQSLKVIHIDFCDRCCSRDLTLLVFWSPVVPRGRSIRGPTGRSVVVNFYNTDGGVSPCHYILACGVHRGRVPLIAVSWWSCLSRRGHLYRAAGECENASETAGVRL